MSILCGLIPPTSGKVTVDGRDLIHEMEYVRKNLGKLLKLACPVKNGGAF